MTQKLGNPASRREPNGIPGKEVQDWDRLRTYLEGQIAWDKPMSPEGCILSSSLLLGRSAQRQEVILDRIEALQKEQKDITHRLLVEAQTLRWLTIALIVLTAVLAFPMLKDFCHVR